MDTKSHTYRAPRLPHVSAQQMLNVIIINGPKSIIKNKEGMNTSSQEGNIEYLSNLLFQTELGDLKCLETSIRVL